MLKQKISEILEIVRNRDSKIKENICDLEAKIESIENKILSRTQNAIEMELEESFEEAAEVRKEITSLLSKAEQYKQELRAYQVLIGKYNIDSQLEEVKKLAKAEKQESVNKQNQLFEEKRILEDNIRDLEQQLQQIDRKLTIRVNNDVIDVLVPLFERINPETKTLNLFQMKRFVKNWLQS